MIQAGFASTTRLPTPRRLLMMMESLPPSRGSGHDERVVDVVVVGVEGVTDGVSVWVEEEAVVVVVGQQQQQQLNGRRM